MSRHLEFDWMSYIQGSHFLEENSWAGGSSFWDGDDRSLEYQNVQARRRSGALRCRATRRQLLLEVLPPRQKTPEQASQASPKWPWIGQTLFFILPHFHFLFSLLEARRTKKERFQDLILEVSGLAVIITWYSTELPPYYLPVSRNDLCENIHPFAKVPIRISRTRPSSFTLLCLLVAQVKPNDRMKSGDRRDTLFFFFSSQRLGGGVGEMQ